MAPKGSESWKIENFTVMFWDLRNLGEWTGSSWTSDENGWTFGPSMMKGNVSRVLSAGSVFRCMTMRPSALGATWTRASSRRFFMLGFPGWSVRLTG